MSDKPTTGTVPMSGALVKQHHRMAAGEKAVGQKLPSAPAVPKPQA